MQRNQLLIFSRWCQVMLRFEKAMYENPEQDLNKLWWDLVEKYQLVKRPKGRNAPDYASKIHICQRPGVLPQLHDGPAVRLAGPPRIAREVFKGADPKTVIYIGDKKVGEFMKKKVFEPGRTLDWNELTKHATGEELNPKAFAGTSRASSGLTSRVCSGLVWWQPWPPARARPRRGRPSRS